MRPFRKEKIASVVRQAVSEAIAHKLHDPRVDMRTTVTRVEMTVDLLIAKVYLTVAGGGTVERRTLQGVIRAGGFLQRQVAKELQIRHCPTLQFEIDRQATDASQTQALLAENLRKDPSLADPIEEPMGDRAGAENTVTEDEKSGVPDQPQD